VRVLVAGGNGMAGHLLLQYLSEHTSYELFHTTRQRYEVGRSRGLYWDAGDWTAGAKLAEALRPDAIVNCIGILNESAAQRETEAYLINGLLPHRLAAWAERTGGRLIHISTDCVFLGDRGPYSESRIPDGATVYARSKALGEVGKPPHLTVRTSIVGPEIRAQGIGLLQWFMKQQGTVNGYINVLWNGVTTLELAKFVHHALEQGEHLSGLVHLTAPETVSKYELLRRFQSAFGITGVDIRPDGAIVLDRTLQCSRTDLNYRVPGYDVMLKELKDWMTAH